MLLSGSPTIVKDRNPCDTSISTSTNCASNPTMAAEKTFEGIFQATLITNPTLIYQYDIRKFECYLYIGVAIFIYLHCTSYIALLLGILGVFFLLYLYYIFHIFHILLLQFFPWLNSHL